MRVTAALWSAVRALQPRCGAGCSARRVCVAEPRAVSCACALGAASPGYEVSARRDSDNGKSFESVNG